MDEAIRYRISAEDAATQKFRQVREEVEKNVKQVREVGSKAKASTEFVGTLANAMGGSGIGQYAGQVAQLTERISAFSEVSKAGGAGALAFKAGLVGAAGVIGFQIGKALGDVIFQTEKWNKELAKSLEIAKAVGSELQTAFGKQLSRQQVMIDLIVDDGERQKAIEKFQATLERDVDFHQSRVRALSKAGRLDEINQNALEDSKQRVAALREELQALRDRHGEGAKAMELAKKQKADFEKSKNDAEAAANKARQDAAAQADKLLQDQIAKKQRLQDLEKTTLENLRLQVVEMTKGKEAADSLRLQQQGLAKDRADEIARIQNQLQRTENKKMSGPTSDLTTKDERLLSGRGISQKEKQEELLKRANDQSQEQTAILEQINTAMTALEQSFNGPKLQLISFGS